MPITNAIANAGLRVRWNIWNLNLHLCWLTVEQQFIPALAIASAVGNKFKNHGKIRRIKLLRHFFVHWNFSLTDKNCWLDNLDSSARLVRLDWRGTNSRLDKLGWTLRLDRITRQLWQKFSERLSMNFLVNSEFRINLTRLKKRKPIANKRYSKCGFSCSLKHLKSLFTFVLADSWVTIYSRTCHSVTVVKQLTKPEQNSKIAQIWPGRKLSLVHRIPGFYHFLTRLKKSAQEFRPNICVCRNRATSERRFVIALTSHGARKTRRKLRIWEKAALQQRIGTIAGCVNATSLCL